MQDCIRSPRRSAGAAEAGAGGGRKKGRSARGKVEETLTRRSAGAGRNGDARVGYFEIPWAGCRGRRRRLWTPKKKRAKRRSNGDDDDDDDE